MKWHTALLVGLLALNPCDVLAQDVTYDYDNNTDFSKYKTYRWLPIKGADEPDELTAKRIVTALDAELTVRGLSKTDADTADLDIEYGTAISTEKEFTSYSTGWGYGSGWGAGWYGDGGLTTSTTYGSTSTIYIGQLNVSMYDGVTKQLVWRGMASEELDTKAKPEKKEKKINKAVRKLLKDFPPKRKDQP